MATYAIGDIQGCYDELLRLLDKLCFDPASDRLWFVGDVVNRGPKSLETLRFIKGLGDQARMVLGNHEFHLLAMAQGNLRYKRKDTLDEILTALDQEELLHWLRHRPLLHHDETLGYTLIHAGLPPQWDLKTASRCAAEMEAMLRGSDYPEYFKHMYGNEPNRWDEQLTGWDRLRFITNCFTRLRYCAPDGTLALEQKGPPGSQPGPYLPWFAVPARASLDMKIVFGHWSTLGLRVEPSIVALDTGCLWGGRLTAVRLDRHFQQISISCPDAQKLGNS